MTVGSSEDLSKLNSITAAILLLDIRNSTTLLRQKGVETYVSIIQKLHGSITNPISKLDGELLQFTGDGFLVVFRETDEAQEKNVVCPLAVSSALTAAREIVVISKEHDLSIGIGLTYGHVCYGQILPGGASSYTVIGDEVHRADRLQSLCPLKGSHIAISKRFADAAPLDTTRLLDSKSLRGFGMNEEIHGPI